MAQRVLQEPLRPRAQIRASSHPSSVTCQPTCQWAGAAVQFTVTETHLADQTDWTRGGEGET